MLKNPQHSLSALLPGPPVGAQAHDYYLRQARDMEQFARTACSIAQHQAFLDAAKAYRALAAHAAPVEDEQPMAAE